jgi:hypothetical protein
VLSPAIMSEKKIPMDRFMPAFMNVARMPEATPRASAGTVFITADAFGAENRPMARPLKNSSAANGR